MSRAWNIMKYEEIADGVCHYCGSHYTPPPVSVDLRRNVIVIDGRAIRITPCLAEAATTIIRRHPEPVPVEDIASGIWGAADGPEDELGHVRTYISQLRRLLRDADAAWQIKSFRGVGYWFAPA